MLGVFPARKAISSAGYFASGQQMPEDTLILDTRTAARLYNRLFGLERLTDARWEARTDGSA